MSPLPVVPGQVIGQYRIVRKIGAGGMGAVFECVHQTIDRRAALKTLHVDLGGVPGLALRFFNEARAANRVPHPGVVQVFDCGQLDDGALWLLMEFVDGETLHARIDAAMQVPPYGLGLDALPLLHQLASILSVAHKHGIIHRDLKPSNVMLVPDPAVRGGDRVRLVDFGIAKLIDAAVGAGTAGHAGAAGPLTATGAILGTPAYMAPEQAHSAGGVDDRADVYALGVISFQAVLGRLPVDGATPLALLMNKAHYPAPRLRQYDSSLPADLDAMVASMLAIDPAERPRMADIERELAAMLGLSTPRRSRLMTPVAAQAQPPTQSATSARAAESPPLTASEAPTGDIPGERPGSAAPPLELVSAPKDAPAPPSHRPPLLRANPSAPTIRPTSGRSWPLWVAGGVATCALTLAILRWPRAQVQRPGPDLQAAQAMVDLAPPQQKEADAPDLLGPVVDARPSAAVAQALDDRQHPDLAPAADARPDATERKQSSTVRSRAASSASCVAPKASCIGGAISSVAIRDQVVLALQEAQVRLCGSDHLTFDLRGSEPVLLDVPARFDSEDRRALRIALRGRLQGVRVSTIIEVRCRR